MLPSFLLALREGLEAALLIGIVLGALTKLNRPELKRSVWQGVAVALGFSLLAALALYLVGAEFAGSAEEIFEGTAMLLAAGILTWMIFWMQRQSRTLKSELETDVRRAVLRGGKGAVFSLALLAVGREGLELALFLIATGMATTAAQTLVGALAGLALSIVLGWLFFSSTRRLNLRAFFQVSNVLLVLFAAGLVAHGVHEFNEAGVIPSVIEHVWDINGILDERSVLGSLLTALFGYNGNPSLTEVAAYLAYFALLPLLGRVLNPAPLPEAAAS